MRWRNMHVQFHLLWILTVKSFLDFNEKVKWDKWLKKKKKKKKKERNPGLISSWSFLFLFFLFLTIKLYYKQSRFVQPRKLNQISRTGGQLWFG